MYHKKQTPTGIPFPVQSVYTGDTYYTSKDLGEKSIDGVTFIMVAMSLKDFANKKFLMLRKDAVTRSIKI